ncbi:MAG TPA: peptidoglycan recognition family protein [Ktedonobacteraceae bacterium]|jgi:N-acetyl-anhydromuramyl-L-alanine amidase AmpD|nr:peptidoglycan recognition family protein [Ktedonobacteraceae bacterium]
MGTNEIGVLSIQNNNFFSHRNGYKAKWLILHGTAGGESAQGVANYFQTTQGTGNPVTSHYVIGQDGTVVQCCSEEDGAYANGILSNGHDAWWSNVPNPNLVTISIEHVKRSTDNSNALTPAQQAASFKLIKHICERQGIPKRFADKDGGITGHFSLDPVSRRHCPGSYPWDALWAFLKGTDTQKGTTMAVPHGWQDNGTILTAPNGVRVQRGFREYVLKNSWDSDNWPLQAEMGATQLELSNPSLGAGTRQLFRKALLEFTPSRGVFEAWIGAELYAHQLVLATLQSQLLQAQVKLQQHGRPS